MSTGSTDYAVIGPIKETPDHVFAYTGARSAMVIPKRGQDVTLLSRFVSELTRHIEIAKVGSAIERPDDSAIAANLSAGRRTGHSRR
jgi:hypothetical protein